MSPKSTGVPMAAALLLCLVLVPQARSSDTPQEDNAAAIADPQTDVENAAPIAETNASKASEPVSAAAAATDEPAKDGENWVCRKETPTGSHRRIKVCRRAADIAASSEEVGQVMNRQRHYGNPSVTPEG